ncbi:MAG: DMT family transporter [Pseudomonadota bacterium]
MTESTKSQFALLLTVILWASAFVGIRYAMRSCSAGSLGLMRYAIASATIVFPFARLKKINVPTLKEIPGFFLLGLFGFAIYNVALNYGERTVTAGVANFVIAQAPILTVIFAIFIFKDKLRRWAWLGFLLSLLGALLILLGEAQHELGWGIAFIYLATVVTAIYAIQQKVYTKKYRPLEITAYAIWGGTIAMLIYLPDAIHDLRHINWQTFLTIIYLGVFPGVIGYLCWCYGFKYNPAAKAASYLYSIPIFTLFFAWLFLSEIPHIISVTGGFVSLLGAIVIGRFGTVKKDSASS